MEDTVLRQDVETLQDELDVLSALMNYQAALKDVECRIRKRLEDQPASASAAGE